MHIASLPSGTSRIAAGGDCAAFMYTALTSDVKDSMHNVTV